MDDGDVPSVRKIHTTVPNGRFPHPPGRDLSWRLPAPWPGAQRLLRIPVDAPHEVEAIAPFGTAGGGVIAPPVHVPEHDLAVAWDSVNGGLAGVATGGPRLEVAWHLDVRPSMQPLVFPDRAELVINDYTAEGTDDLVVVDLRSGTLLDRVATGSRIANGMFLAPTGDRGVLYCTTTTVAHARWT
jgi:hypothetical protein